MAAADEASDISPEAPTAPARKLLSWVWLLRMLGFVLGIYALEQDIEGLLLNAQMQPAAGAVGASNGMIGGSAPGYVIVSRINPEGAMARAGVVEGDQVRYDRVYDQARLLTAGERLGLTINHGGHLRHTVITVLTRPKTGPYALTFWTQSTANVLSCLVMVIFGLFILWRGRQNLTTILLSLGLITYGLATALPQFSMSSPELFLPAFVFGGINYAAIPVLFYVFAMQFYADNITAPKRWEYGVLALYAVIQVACVALLMHFLINVAPLGVFGNGYDLSTVVSYIGFIAAFGYLFMGWRRSPPQNQQRYALMLVAISAIIVAQAIAGAMFFLSIVPKAMVDPLGIFAAVLAGIVAPLLFAYVILRHKVFDLGFAVNRTLVYGAVSAILLVAFGLAEWAFEHFLPVESHEASAMVDAGIALVIFLVFHRVRDFVEHNIEKLFFHQWHKKEAELKTFVREAGFILKRDPMITAYVTALRKFCDGAECALYLADDSGAYRLAEGGLAGMPGLLDPDDPFMVTLRADRSAFEPGANTAAVIMLVLPMIHRTEVIGVTLLGRKPSGFGYRPDEKEVLAYAAHQIGLDLHALEVERLQHANQALEMKYSELRLLTEGVLGPRSA